MAFRLRKSVSISLLAFVAFSSSASCRLKSEPNYQGHFPFAYVQEGCGPADGPALLFYFTVKSAKDGQYEEPFLLIQIIANLPKAAPHAYAMGPGSRDILASRCQSPGHCEAATSGVLHLTKFSPRKSASGDYELHFRDESIEKGQFDATWCLVNLICR